MGDRKCAFEGCNALEFRATGYCLRHKGGVLNVKHFNFSDLEEKDSKQPIPQIEVNWTLVFLVWLFPPILIVIIPIMFLNRLQKDILKNSKEFDLLKNSNKEDIEEKDDGQSDNSDHTVYETTESGSPDASDDPWWVVDGNSSDDNRIF